MTDVRKLALDAIERIWCGHKPKETLEAIAGGLEKKDRSFLMELVYGVIRYRDTLDWSLKKFLKNPQRLPSPTINNLRLGVYQIFYMRVPEWAAVNEAVSMEEKSPGLVNAVLRNIVRERQGLESEMNEMRLAISTPSTDDALKIDSISTLTSHPKWLMKRWVKRMGYEEAFSLAGKNNEVPCLTLRVNTLRAGREEILKKLKSLGIEAWPTSHSPDGIRLEGFHNFSELFKKKTEAQLSGSIIAQDEAAQLMAYMLGPKIGERVLDTCAAPGGKTTHIAQLMKDGGEVVAVDNSEKRLHALRENLAVLGINSVRVIKADINDFHDKEGFDRILLDAPCSAMGVIRRNPDVKYRHKAADLMEFQAKQLRMLQSASLLLKKGGVMLYTTCSTEPEEGEEVIKKFLKNAPDFYIIEKSDAGFIKRFLMNGFMRTYPHRDDMDGFFGALVCKR